MRSRALFVALMLASLGLFGLWGQEASTGTESETAPAAASPAPAPAPAPAAKAGPTAAAPTATGQATTANPAGPAPGSAPAGTNASPTTVEPSPTPDAATVPASELAQATERIGVLNEQIASLTKELDTAEERLGSVTKDLEAEKAARESDAEAAGALQSDLFATVDTAKTEAEDLKAKLAERDGLADKLASLETEKERLVASLGAEQQGRIDLADWPVVLVSGFDKAKPRIGKWKLSANYAEQLNSKEFFSRLEMPLEQKAKPFLYRFTANSNGDGWVGVGIHFFSSDVKSRRGYGEGRSLLVWFTRDPAVRKTNATWLQLYRSDTDVIMERVLDAKIEEGIGGLLAVEVLYDPASGNLSVTVNGRLAVRYRAWFGIDQGLSVSLRTLGAGGRFTDFEVRTRE